VQNYQVEEKSLFRSVLLEVMAPLQRGTLSIKEQVSSTVEHYFLIVNTSKENVLLKKEVLKLENTIFSLGEVQKENERLKQLLEFGKEIPRKKVLAQVVSWDSSNGFKVLRINKGSNSGIKKMSPVITMTGLVGYIYRVTNNYADVLTILDQNNRVDSIVAKTRTHGIVEGESGFKCHLKYVNRTEKLELGYEVITAGLGEIYPKGIKVGKITRIDKENYGITQKIEITPSVDFHKLEEVVVLFEDESAKEIELISTPVEAIK
jgi:rod shape-determining protein MreC